MSAGVENGDFNFWEDGQKQATSTALQEMKIRQGPISMVYIHKWMKNKDVVSFLVKGQEVSPLLKARWLGIEFTWVT